MKLVTSFLLVTLLFTSCVGIKYLPPGESILYKHKIKSSGNLNKETLNNLLEQKPNKKLIETKLITLPISHRVYVYHWGKNNFDSVKILSKRRQLEEKFDRKMDKASTARKQARLNEKKISKLEKIDTKLREGNLFMRWGEELAVYDSNAMDISKQKLKTYLFTKGYFDAQVQFEKTQEDQLVELTYTIVEKQPYTIDSLIFSIKDEGIKKLFFDHIREHQLLGKRYDETLISNERNRVYELLVNNGYYDFKRQYVHFEVDSTLLDGNRLVIRETILNAPGNQRHKIFRIDSVIFTTESGARSSLDHQLETYNNVTYDFSSNKYPERLLDWRIFLEKDSIYRKDLTLQTQRQLSHLDIFKFVNINYDSTGGKFVANIFTSPLKKFQTSTETGLSVLDQAGLPGPFINFNAKSRNIFRGLEIIQFDGNAGIMGIQSFQGETNYSRLQYGGQFSVTFPQFLFPLKNSLRKRIGRYNPRTKFATGLNFEDRRDEYERITLNGNISYIWQVRDNIQFTLKPADLSYIWSNPESDFRENVLNSLPRSLSSAFQSSFVSFSSIGMDVRKNNYGIGNTDASLVRAYFESGGNLELITGEPIFDPRDSLAYYKYLKTSFDFRRNKRINESTALAYRINVGVALAYDNNNALPYEKYFFAGGSNSIRAWEPRRLGPGGFAMYDSLNSRGQPVINNTLESPGDILLEASIEFRKDLVGFLEYALFIDMGNTWLWKSRTVSPDEDGFGPTDNSQNDNGVFKLSSFPREIAVGAGFGLRFDFSFLLLRLDAAYKIVDPAYPLGERFILNGYNFQDLWNDNKMSVNIGIGYPF